MTLVETRGLTFNTRVDGPEGAPWMVLSNSLGSNFHMWDEQIGLLTGKYRVLRYDHRGHGGTEVPEGPYSWDQLTGDVVNLMDAVGIERADYMGLSMGLMTGLGLGIHHGARFGKLVLCDGRGDAPPPFQEMFRGRIAAVRENGMAAMAEATLPMWLSEDFRAENPGRTDELRAMIAETDPKGYIGCVQALLTLDYLKDVGRIGNEVLCVTGSNDMGAMPEVVQGIADGIPNARLEVIEGAHHISNVNKPEAFNAAIAGFLGID